MKLARLLLLLPLAACEHDVANPNSSRMTSARSALSATAATWQTVAPMPTAIAVSGVAMIGSRIYVIGWTGGTLTTPLQAYDPAANAWTVLAPAPTAVGEGSLAAVAGKLYLVGGCAIDADCRLFTTNLLQIYDPATNAWSSGSPMPEPRTGMALAEVNGKLYAAGGIGACPPCVTTAAVEVYDPSTNSWAVAASMPIDVESAGAAVINGKLYVVGGNHLPTPYPFTSTWTSVTSVSVYDPTANAWTTAAPMQTTTHASLGIVGAAAFNGILYSAGGQTMDGVVFNQAESYDPSTDSWSQLPGLPQSVSQGFMTSLNGTLYLGTWGYDASNQLSPSLLTFTVGAAGKADQTIAFGALANRTFGDAVFTVSATASSGLAVTFTASGNCTVAGTTVSITAAGGCTITADQAGDASFNAAPSVAQSFNIAKASQTIAFAGLPNRTLGEADFTVSATASSGLAVSFTAAGACTISGSAVHLSGTGGCAITASQAGDANYNPAPDVTQNFTIGLAAQTITFATLPDHTFGDADFAVNATASSGLAVSFAAAGSCTVSGNTVHLTGAGSCTITASQAGNATYGAAPSVAQSFAIAKAGQTVNFAVLTNKTFGDADFGVSASASSGLLVSFAAAGNCTLSGTTVHITGAGSCTITASQAGDANFNPALSVTQSFTIAKAAQTIAFGALATKALGDADFAVSATASSGLAVSFAAAGSCTVSGTTVHITGAGSCTITASQAGDANFSPAPGVAQSFTILSPQQLTQTLQGTVGALVTAGSLSAGNGNALDAKLQAAIAYLNAGDPASAISVLNAFINQVNALVRTGRLSSADGQALIAAANRIEASISAP